MIFEPTGGNVIIENLEPDEMTSGGVIMPEVDTDSCLKGKVIAKGPGPLLSNGDRGHMQTSKDDIVYYPKFAGKKLEINNKEFVVVQENEILTIFKEKK